jgi:DNA helicase HerA-like ATPase
MVVKEHEEAEDDGAAMPTPKEALAAIDADAGRVPGGPFVPPAGEEGAVGRTMFDSASSEDGTVTAILPMGMIDSLTSQALVRIASKDGRVYLGAVVAGPFAEPDGLRADATPMVVSLAKGGLLLPKHHGRVQIQLIGEKLGGGAVVPRRRRPKPNSPVFALDAHQTAEVLKLEGNLRLGLADGFEDLPVVVPAKAKGLFPRHLGVLGTTGGGKSTTVSGLIARALAEGIAVVLIDTEGEYTHINEPTNDKGMVEALARRGLRPAGVRESVIYHLIGRKSANPGHPHRRPFSLRFETLSPFAVAEILELNEAQEQRFLKAYDIAKVVMERLKIWPVSPEERVRQVELDEMEEGYPKMTLPLLYDVVRAITAGVGKEKEKGEVRLTSRELRGREDEVVGIVGEHKDVPQNKFPWMAVVGKLGRIVRLGIFDSEVKDSLNDREAKPLEYPLLLRPGRVTILDLSDTDSPQINNLVIADLLRGLQGAQEENYERAVEKGEAPPSVLVCIEEAHEFLSAQRIKQMPVLFQQVARIARRGRKRRFGMAFITQLPQHLPDEVLGLINNWILHKIGDANVITRLRRSIGGIDDSLWARVPALAPGQAVVSLTTLGRALQVSIDPTPCKLRMVE